MTKYLLLRDNKQSGPHTLDEIKEIGLKKYDLIWIEGKSAAWRYAGEIEEMRPFAPAVEEQPFDRFFRKPIREEQQHLQLGERKRIHEEKPVDHPTEEKKPTTRKYVAVTLPGRKGEAGRKKVELKVEEAKVLQPIFPEKAKEEVLPANALANPLTEKRLEEERQRPASPDLMKFLALGVGLGSMVLIAYLVMSDPYGASTYSAPPKSVVAPVKSEPQPEVQQMISIQAVNTAPAVTEPVVEEETPEARPVRKIAPRKKAGGAVPAKPGVNKPIPEKKAITLSGKVKLVTGDYRVNIFGGIDDLDITVQNNSPYLLDVVLVEVNYLRSNNKVFKTETLRFRNIAAGAKRVIQAPKTTKGIQARSRITYITSSQAGVSENL